MNRDTATTAFPPFFSDPQEEYRAVRDGAGLAQPPADYLEMTGEDRARFLNGQVTCDVASLAAGEPAYGFFTTAKGRVEADVTVLNLQDRFILELPVELGSQIEERLNKYKIVDRVDIRPVEIARLTLLGPDAEKTEATSGLETLGRRVRSEAVDLWVEATALDAAREALKAAGAHPVGRSAFERRRVEAGEPVWGMDFGLDHFPQETGLEAAVSYTKGCYLGQEVVARIHYRGGVQRRLRGLRIQGTAAESARSAEARFEGKAVGRVGTVVETESEVLGLAIPHDKATVGSTVALFRDDTELGSAEVVELPF